MEFSKPEGCRAAVTANWVDHTVGSTLTARMVCGDRDNVTEGSFSKEMFNINHAIHVKETGNRVGRQVTEVLAAMCLGCPHNTANVDPAD